ncbi:MAG TPA: DUF481 domain-containing protein [Alcanivoracaceae bacterium]|nr:DUF481 domain-containing protein [Alcanivoracaceae bacterium]
MRRFLLVTTVATMLAPSVSMADFKGWEGELGLDYSMQRGNSYSNTLATRNRAERDTNNWRHLAKAEALNKETRSSSSDSKERIDERYFSSYKLDKKFGEANYLFNQLSAEKDRFSGYNYQATYAFGYGRRIIDSPKHRLDIEAGPGFRVRELEERPADWNPNKSRTEKDGIGLVAARYRWKISPSTRFEEDVSAEIEGGSSVTRSETSLTTKVNSRLALRLSHILRYNSKPSGDDVRKSDQETLIGLVWTL